jgi:hypothetical protein
VSGGYLAMAKAHTFRAGRAELTESEEVLVGELKATIAVAQELHTANLIAYMATLPDSSSLKRFLRDEIEERLDIDIIVGIRG